MLLLISIVPLPSLAVGPAGGFDEKGDLGRLVAWLLHEDRDLTGIPFADVIQAVAGKEVLPVEREDERQRRLLREIGRVVDRVLVELNGPEHPIHQVGRINEVSGHIEDLLVEKLNRVDGMEAGVPLNASGRAQRAGYPDIRIMDTGSGRVFYLDPKLYAAGSETSTFRTFYFEPKVETNKILDDAVHLILGIEHGGRKQGRWEFRGWKLADLAKFEVRLKAEFQAGNRDLYQPEAIVAEGEAEERD